MALPKPIGRQMDVVYLAGAGHNVVLGTAGSGKTSMAILRAAVLSDRQVSGGGPTLLITFNKTLGTYIRFLAKDVIDRVTVENFHLFARGYLNARGLMSGGAIAGTLQHRSLVGKARLQLLATKPTEPIVLRPASFFEDEFKWMAQHGIRTLPQYEASERIGRAGARVTRLQKPIVWEVYEAYRQLRTNSGHRYNNDDIALAVIDAFAADQSLRKYKHVVIDEGQDLSPTMLQALAKAIPVDGSLTLFGDVAQQIYGHRLSWRAAGLHPPKIWMFEENYRNSKAIAELALAISRMPYYAEAADLVTPRQPSADGPKPTLVAFSDETRETQFVIDRALASRGRSVAILTRTDQQAERIAARLTGPVQKLEGSMRSWTGGPGISVGNLHNGKGLEFDVVLLPYLSAARFPHPRAIEVDGIEDATAADGRLLYVGVTRARSELIITHTGDITPLLPSDVQLFTRATR